MTQDPRKITALSEISDRYEGYLIDQWGVLHNGVDIYPDALKALAALKAAGKRVVILSNSGRSGQENTRLMAQMGIAPALYDRVLSAGDDAYDALNAPRDRDYALLGKRVYLMARERDHCPLFDMGYEPAARVEDADFLFLLSMEVQDRFPAEWQAVLQQARARNLPLICANPDFERVNGAGDILLAPGALARLYQDMGGISHYHGKPHARIYKTAMAYLGLPARSILAIGDSLLHDMAGARAAGIDSLFIIDGVHRDKINAADPASLMRELQAHAPNLPQYVQHRLA